MRRDLHRRPSSLPVRVLPHGGGAAEFGGCPCRGRSAQLPCPGQFPSRCSSAPPRSRPRPPARWLCVLARRWCSRRLSSARALRGLSLQRAARTGESLGNSVCSACQLFTENSDLSSRKIKKSKIPLSHMDTEQRQALVESPPWCLRCRYQRRSEQSSGF